MKKLKHLLMMVCRLLFGTKTSTQENNQRKNKTAEPTTSNATSPNASSNQKKNNSIDQTGQATTTNETIPTGNRSSSHPENEKPLISPTVSNRPEVQPITPDPPNKKKPEKPTGKTFIIPSNDITSQRTGIASYLESITGKIDESIFDKEYIVNYKPSDNYNQVFPMKFPYVLMPEEGTLIKPPVNGSSANKGMLEANFCRDYLMRYFRGNVFDNLTLFAGETPYEPDLALIDVTTGKNIFIDIEIDEPYDGVSRIPTHYRTEGDTNTIDGYRNQSFAERGWMVIRFAEQQVEVAPLACCRFIAEVIKFIQPGFINECLYLSEELKEVNIWTYAEAKEMAHSGTRESYLGISQFHNRMGINKTQVNDSYHGKQIEEKLKRKKTTHHKISIPEHTSSKPAPSSEPSLTRTSISYPIANNVNKPIAERTNKEQYIREKAHGMQSGVNKVTSSGTISTTTGVASRQHRFFGDVRARTKFSGIKPENCYTAAYIQMRDIIKKYSFLKCAISNDTLFCTGTIHLENCEPYKIRIESRANYQPIVYILSHNITPHPDIHMYNDRSLCLYYPGDLKWKTNTSIADNIVPWIFEWILFYELYKLTGIWEGAFVPHDNIESFTEICMRNGNYSRE